MAIDGGLSQLFQANLRGFHWQRIETGGTGLGIPDLNYCCRGVEGWVELKLTQAWSVPLRPEQVGWLMRRSRAGGRCHIAVRRRAPAGQRRTACDELWLLPGGMAQAAKEAGLRALQEHPDISIWGGGPSNWSWTELASKLTSPEVARILPLVRP
jgi:hypothetical protein